MHGPTAAPAPLNPDYEDNAEFNDWIDSRNGTTVLMERGRFDHFCSDVIYQVEPDLYEDLYGDFLAEQERGRQDELRRFKDRVIQTFPSPVAYAFWRFERRSEDRTQRPALLRDVWESVIYVLYAVVMAQFRCSGLDLKHTKYKIDHVMDFSLDTKLTIIEGFMKRGTGILGEMPCLAFITADLIDALRRLNGCRNEFSHGHALSVEASNAFIEEHEGEVLEMLRLAAGLEAVTLLRYHGDDGAALTLRMECFVGHSLAYEITTETIDSTQFGVIARHLTRQRVLVRMGEQLYGAAPFLHYKQAGTSTHTQLSVFKQEKKKMLHFAALGETTNESIDPSVFAAEIGDLEARLS